MPVRINGNSFTVVDSEALRTDTAWSFEVEGSASAEYRLAESGQTDPKGRWRWKAQGNQLRLEQASTAKWAEITNLLTIDYAERRIVLNDKLITTRGYNVEASISELIERMDAAANQIRYLVMALADMGLDLPDQLVEALDQLVYHPAELTMGAAVGV